MYGQEVINIVNVCMYVVLGSFELFSTKPGLEQEDII